MSAPKFSLITDKAFRFIIASGIGGGIMWKVSSMMGSDHYDHQMLGNGDKAPEKAKEAERLLRRHSTHQNAHFGGEHQESKDLKAAL
jgi:hypothetical protein